MKLHAKWLVYLIPVIISALGAIISIMAFEWVFVICVLLNCIGYSIWFIIQSLYCEKFRLRNIVFMLLTNMISCFVCCIPIFISYSWSEFQSSDAGIVLVSMLIISMFVTGVGGLIVWLYRRIAYKNNS